MARALVVAVFAAGVVAGCGDGRPAADAPLRFQLFGDAEEVAAYRAVASAYRARTGASVEVVAVGDRKDHLAKLSAAFAARRPPEVFLVNSRNVGPFVARGGIDPAGPAVDAPGGLQREDFEPIALAAFASGGELACLPQNVSSLVVYYNLDLFGAAGLQRPPRDWQYADFLAAARRLTRGGVRGVGLDPTTVRASAFVWSAGGEVVDDDDTPTRLRLSDPGSIRGLQALIGLREAGVTPTRTEDASRGPDNRFVRGEVAMFLSSRREVPAFRSAITDFEWDVAPFPFVEHPASVLHADAFCVSRGPRAAAAHRFAQFAAGPQGARILARAGRTVPALKAVARSPAFLDRGRAPASDQVFLDAIASLRRLPSVPGWPRVEEIVDAALERAYYGEVGLDEAIATAQDEAGGALR